MSAGDLRRRIVEDALQRLGDSTLDDVFKATTPEQLARDAPYAASTVRYHFGNKEPMPAGGGRLSFVRRALVLEMLAAATADATDNAARITELYLRAAEGLPTGDTVDDVFAAIADNLRAFTPGATDEDVSPRERMLYLAVAMCDDDPDVARLLRDARNQQLETFESLYEAFMAVVGRRLRPGVELQDLASAINAMLEGHLARMRYDPATSGAWVGEAVLSIFAGFTERIDGTTRPLRDELLG
jgi:AcrR family transcriptional regulator